MTPVQIYIAVFALLTFKLWMRVICNELSTGFASEDIFREAHHEQVERARRRFLNPIFPPLGLMLILLALTPWQHWKNVDPDHVFRPIILTSSGIVTWRAISMDIDLATGNASMFHRLLMLLTWIGVWFHPAFLILLLHTGITWLRSYYHHQHLAI